MSERDGIRSKCACKHDDARACLQARHPEIRRRDDDPDAFSEQFTDEVCECHCHVELRELDGSEPWEERP